MVVLLDEDVTLQMHRYLSFLFVCDVCVFTSQLRVSLISLTGCFVEQSEYLCFLVMSPQNQSPNPPNDFESVELEELDKGVQQKEKAPRRIIHFSSGETMEEYSTDEEEDGEEKEQERKDLLSSPVDAVRVRTSERTVDLMTETVSSLFVLK